MTRRSEIDWLYRGVAPLFPEQWERFCAGIPEADRDGDLVAAYYRLLQSTDPDVCVCGRQETGARGRTLSFRSIRTPSPILGARNPLFSWPSRAS